MGRTAKVDPRQQDLDEAMMLLAGNLQKRRKAKNVSAKTLGLACSLSDRTYCNKENDPGTFTLDQLIRVMQLLGFTKHELMETFDLVLERSYR